MNIQHSQSEKKGRFFYEVENIQMAEMTYTKAGEEKLIIDHTEVDPSLKGQGVGYALVNEAVEFARANNLKIMPLCPFAAAVFKKKSEYRDVIF